MSELNKRAEYTHYDSLPTEELQEILRKHANDELETEPDTDELYYIMEVLTRRREQQDPQAFRSNEDALADFRKHYMPTETKTVRPAVMRFPNRFLRTVAALLVAVLIFAAGTSITAEALQIDLWSKFATWTKEIFQFSDIPQETTAADPEKENNLELKSLQDALAKEKITEKLIPSWMPEGYKSKGLNIISTPRVINISAVYEKNGSELIIKIRQTIGTQAAQVEKNDDLLEIYTVNGVDYYVFSNNATLQAVWSIGEFECLIAGRITLEEMKSMIDSI